MMIQKKYGKSLTIATAILSLLFLSHVKIQAADPPKPKPLPGIQMLLLSDNAPQPPPVPQPNIAFVTSSTVDGGFLGSLEAADKICQSLAEAARLPRNTYMAWLSTSSVDAIDRLGSARGWVRVDGKPFADTKKDIFAGKILHPLGVDEKRFFCPRCDVWTGTSPEGTRLRDETCGDWNSPDANARTGTDAGVTGIFTSYSSAHCDTPNHLYCFGINNNVQVTVNPVVGRIAFVTNGSWTPSGRRVDADGLCQKEAADASLSGNFIALLAAADQSAAERFKASGLPWVRPDGVAIAPTAEALFSAHPLDTAINVTADGRYIADEGVWGGALAPYVAGTLETTCDNWTSPGKDSTGRSGGAAFTDPQDYFGKDLATCDIPKRLYCLQVPEF
jgi:hypothetical protein